MTKEISGNPQEQPYTWIISEQQYSELDEVVHEAYGRNLEELAAQDPRDAFKVIETAREIVDKVGVVAVRDNKGRTLASIEEDGELATSGMVSYLLEAKRRDIDAEAFDVILYAWKYPTQTFGEYLNKLIRTRSHKEATTERVTPKLKFRVEPMNLA